MSQQRKLRIELGRKRLGVDSLPLLDVGSIVALDQAADDDVEIYLDHALAARGQAVVMDGELCVRVRQTCLRFDKLAVLSAAEGPAGKACLSEGKAMNLPAQYVTASADAIATAEKG